MSKKHQEKSIVLFDTFLHPKRQIPENELHQFFLIKINKKYIYTKIIEMQTEILNNLKNPIRQLFQKALNNLNSENEFLITHSIQFISTFFRAFSRRKPKNFQKEVVNLICEEQKIEEYLTSLFQEIKKINLKNLEFKIALLGLFESLIINGNELFLQDKQFNLIFANNSRNILYILNHIISDQDPIIHPIIHLHGFVILVVFLSSSQKSQEKNILVDNCIDMIDKNEDDFTLKLLEIIDHYISGFNINLLQIFEQDNSSFNPFFFASAILSFSSIFFNKSKDQENQDSKKEGKFSWIDEESKLNQYIEGFFLNLWEFLRIIEEFGIKSLVKKFK
ncbi:hypothetical protein M0811_10033 [Anaeramoeba ignava]|uniref:Uncharacterized protein n=1 Tax=Anaeramoeba ignava TaxID=1746090 RepID=A0A9Q0RAD8_ANAIG|nr:hypothetical protein M0811_10033 [Anaeramoeba ignava]